MQSRRLETKVCCRAKSNSQRLLSNNSRCPRGLPRTHQRAFLPDTTRSIQDRYEDTRVLCAIPRAPISADLPTDRVQQRSLDSVRLGEACRVSCSTWARWCSPKGDRGRFGEDGRESEIKKSICSDTDATQISPTPIRPANKSRTSAVMSYAQSSRPAAEEQFLEQNPWANPQHPVHRFNLNRQLSQSSPPPVEQVTPAQPTTTTLAAGSASTIVENPSAQASSMANTPYEDKIDPRNGVASTSHPTYRNDSASPFEARKAGLSNATASAVNSTANANGISVNPNDAEPNSSPLATRTVIPPAKTASPPPRAPEQDMDHLQQRLDGAVSPPPSILDRLGTTKDSGTNIMSSAGLTRFKV